MERRGRPPSFDRNELVAAARHLGPDAMSLPAVAEQLGVARTSIYWHVRDREELGELVLEAIIDEGQTALWKPESGCSWNAVMESYARTTRGGLLAAEGWIRYATPRLVLRRAQLRAMNELIERLRECGFSIRDATHAFVFLFQIILASTGFSDAPVTVMHRALLSELATGDTNDLQTLHDAAVAAARTSPDAQFEYDLECALRGIADRSGVALGIVPTSSA
jgi:AcrR family transcriptional regulator